MRFFGGVLALMLVSAGCGGSSGRFRDAVRGRAATSMSCPDAHIDVTELGGGGFLAAGCGRRQSFTCLTTRTSWARDIVCTPDSPVTTTGGEEAPSTRADDDEVVRAVAAGCDIDRSAVVVVHVTPDGRPERVETGALTGASGTCVATELQRTRFLARPSPEVARVEVTPTPFAAAASDAPSHSHAGASTAAELVARAHVDALRDAILACTSSNAAAVEAAWSADGTLTLRLPEARAGTPEDGCVRALSSGLSISPAPGTAGSVLHPVH